MRPRRLALPSEVAAKLDLARGERALAWALGRDGRWYIGTDRALHLGHGQDHGQDHGHEEGHGQGHGRNEGHAFHTLPWEEIERADWNRDTETLVIVEVTSWGEPEKRVAISLDQPGQLLELLRERVTKSVVINVYAAVRGRRGLSVIGRRSPAGDGQVTWAYVLATGLDPEDPQVQDVASRTLSEAEAELAGL
jgi:hypothetical protein